MNEIEVVCAVIINKNKEILCCQRPNNKKIGLFYEFPGGKVEKGESKEEAIIREIKEELLVDIKPLKYIGTIRHTYNETDPFSINLSAYISKIINGNITLIEHLNAIWVNVKDLNKVNFAGADLKIIDLINKMDINNIFYK